MTLSDHIYEIIAWLRRCGVVVHEHAHLLPPDVGGMYRSETREIFLNEPRAHHALLTLAHEAGHWLGYLIDEKPHSYQRERQAFVYGWHVLQWFSVDVSREAWIARHRDSERFYADPPETEHLYLAN